MLLSGMVGLEQTVVPLLGKVEFGIESNAILLSFIASFGVVKAILNLYAGALSDKWGRKKVLVLGWLFGLPVPFIVLYATDWSWVIFANILLGVNQGLAWSMTVNMKIDLVGKDSRGFALGLNEFAGYVSVAAVAFVTGYVASAYGMKPYPFYFGIALALLGTAVSIVAVKDTRKFTSLEVKQASNGNLVQDPSSSTQAAEMTFRQVFAQTSWKNKTLLSATQAGLVNNLVFGVSWGLLTLYFASFGTNVGDIGFLKSLHPGVWGVLQLVTGPLSDRTGRKVLIYPGMILQGVGIWALLFSSSSLYGWIAGMSLLGIGTALVYPALLAAISDVAYPKWRATSLGVYRFWRDLGFVAGAMGVGYLADAFGMENALHAVAWFAIASGIFVLVAMRETLVKRL